MLFLASTAALLACFGLLVTYINEHDKLLKIVFVFFVLVPVSGGIVNGR